MMKSVLSSVVAVVATTLFTSQQAFAQATTTPTNSPGTIVSSPANAGRVKCWVSRSSEGGVAVYKHAAIAISVWEEGTDKKLVAKFRRYTKTLEEYSAMSTKINVPNAVVPETTLPIQVRLVPIANRPNSYSMVYDHTTSVSVTVGSLRFVPGTIGRAATDVVVRLQKGVVDGITVDPCSEPPIDDMGEEEEMDVSPISERGPGSSLSFVTANSNQPNAGTTAP